MELGDQIRILRKKNKISPKKLVLGLCSERTLNYIEAGTEIPDKMLADMLIQRLGKSPDKLELIISKEIYQLERMQDLFEEALERKNRRRAEYLLEKYAEIAPKSNTYRMYYCRSRAYLSFRLDGSLEEALDWLEKALDITLPGWKGSRLEDYLVSTLELENLLAYAKLRMREGTKTGQQEAERLLLSCQTYIDVHVLDGEEHAKVYCKCADLLAEWYLLRGETLRAGELCERALEELRDFGILYYMRPLLKKLACLENAVFAMEKQEEYRRYLQVLDKVYKHYEEDWHFTDSIFKNCCQRTYYMDYELIRGERLAQGFTQEQLIEGIYENPESLSRVESGKSSPRNKTFVQLLERLGIEKGRYNTFIATESFEELERKKELDRLTSQKRYKEAEAKLQGIKETLDLQVTENGRVIRGLELALESVLNQRSAEELLKEMSALLLETYPLNQKENIRVPLDREAYLINHVAILLRKSGRNEEVEALYAVVLSSMEKSRIRATHRFRSYNTLATNYAKQRCSAALARKNIKYILEVGKFRNLYMNYLTEACALIDNPANLVICREMLTETYYLCKLAKNMTDVEVICEYYKEKFQCNMENV